MDAPLDLGFKTGQFSRIITIVGSIWQRYRNDYTSYNILVAHLRLYRDKIKPYDASYIQGHDTPIVWWNSIEIEPNYLQELALKVLAIVPNNIQKLETIAKLCIYYNSNTKKELSYFANLISEKDILEILNQTNIEMFETILDREGLNKNELLISNNLDSDETYTTKDDLVLFLETSLDLDDKTFIDDLEKFPNEDNYENLLLETNEILENIEKKDNQISGQDDYNWNPEDFLNSDDD
ncbi:hypothetical protein C2G38_2189086 [Gigaspora rosea]|uniref:HAT C-terminal dimerisation domain-containing protein n=1 Tax=Gigaspora rosea TaxID=44941 RepID=A0A397V2R2_9GLOM|nr:hypothetical protein C2G38_2189086 [Gigaspora rosea]